MKSGRRRRRNGGQRNGKNNSTCRSSSNGSAFLPKSLAPFDRFFASLLTSSRVDIEKSNDSEDARMVVLKEACGRVGLPLPSPLPATYKDRHQFFSTRASLVLEESRAVLSDALVREKRQNLSRRKYALRLRLLSVKERPKTGHLMLELENDSDCYAGPSRMVQPFTSTELFDMRPGCCYNIIPLSVLDGTPGETATNTEQGWPVLASVQPSHNFDSLGNALTLTVFRREVFDTIRELVQRKSTPGEESVFDRWMAVPVATLISQVRQFEACTRAPNVAFLPKLLGWKAATHTRFSDSESGIGEDAGNMPTEPVEDVNNAAAKSEAACSFALPVLNATQQKAASQFLRSPPSTLSLVQGPPGTGKSHFIVALILQCLLCSSVTSEQHGAQKRIMVSAPTNKALMVLATKYLDVTNGDSSFNVVLIGVEDKLMSEDASDENGQSLTLGDTLRLGKSKASCSSLRDIFVYTWLQSIVEQFQRMKRDLLTGKLVGKGCLVLSRARMLIKKLKCSIPANYGSSGADNVAEEFLHLLEEVVSSRGENCATAPSLCQNEKVQQSLSSFITCLLAIDSGMAIKELLATANVIFCTLTTAGVSLLKSTKRIDDLFVDEAAAATEAEMCIPFHLKPDRMIAVGDPAQLPATIFSQHAIEMGFAKSMHQRLMYDCNHDHIMLDVQYRMNPAICAFPSNQFYGDQLMNGENVASPGYRLETSIFDGRPYTFFDVSGCESTCHGGSFLNGKEGLVVVDLVKKLKNTLPASRGDKGGNLAWDSPSRIRVITFYQGQVNLIKNLLRKSGMSGVTVATVDSSQGCEADIVIISFVRSNRRKGKFCTGFLTDNRRLNVALTRAKYQLICVGDAFGTLHKEEKGAIREMVNDASQRNVVVLNQGNSQMVADICEKEMLVQKQIKAYSEEVANTTDPQQKKRKMQHIIKCQKTIITIKKLRLSRLVSTLTKEDVLPVNL